MKNMWKGLIAILIGFALMLFGTIGEGILPLAVSGVGFLLIFLGPLTFWIILPLKEGCADKSKKWYRNPKCVVPLLILIMGFCIFMFFSVCLLPPTPPPGPTFYIQIEEVLDEDFLKIKALTTLAQTPLSNVTVAVYEHGIERLLSGPQMTDETGCAIIEVPKGYNEYFDIVAEYGGERRTLTMDRRPSPIRPPSGPTFYIKIEEGLDEYSLEIKTLTPHANTPLPNVTIKISEHGKERLLIGPYMTNESGCVKIQIPEGYYNKYFDIVGEYEGETTTLTVDERSRIIKLGDELGPAGIAVFAIVIASSIGALGWLLRRHFEKK